MSHRASLLLLRRNPVVEAEPVVSGQWYMLFVI
jgi:hypothetical protein